MVVISISCCPPKLRGDITRWMTEIDTGVYVGNLSARVRDDLWERVCRAIGSGHACMVYNAANEQKMEFKVFNTVWEPIDYDGICLVRRNTQPEEQEGIQMNRAVIQHRNRIKQQNKKPLQGPDKYVVIDIETTGLQQDAEIIELGAAISIDGQIQNTLSMLVKSEKALSQDISDLTGITQEMLDTNGIILKEAMEKFVSFIGDNRLVGYNVGFDISYIQLACQNLNIQLQINEVTDIMKLAKRELDLDSYKLSAVADELNIKYEHRHRALEDCKLTQRIYEKLKEK